MPCYADHVKEVCRIVATGASAPEMPTTAGVPRVDGKPTARHAPPASVGLTAGASKAEHADVRRVRRHPALTTRPSLATTEALIAMAVHDTTSTPQQMAIKLGMGADGRTVRQVIKAARKAFAERVEDYVEIHHKAAIKAYENGDPKSLAVAIAAAEFALQRIAEDGDRVVDKESNAPTQPSLKIGIAIGGVPGGLPALPTLSDVTPEPADAELVPESLKP